MATWLSARSTPRSDDTCFLWEERVAAEQLWIVEFVDSSLTEFRFGL